MNINIIIVNESKVRVVERG